LEMCSYNETEVTDILLLGFHDINNYKSPLFILFLLIYSVILCGNILIFSLVTLMENLQMPMFFFLKHLGLADVLLTTSVVPMMLHIILNDELIITLVGCIGQLYIFGLSGFVQCFLLAVMSYDRYLAICYPLHYISIMSPNVCLLLVAGCWLLVFILITTDIIMVWQLQFCGFNQIDHFFCDFGPVVALSTSDTSAVLVVFIPVILIIISYVFIIHTVLKIVSTTGRQKAFSTCSSHLIVVLLFYGSLVGIYVVPPRKQSMTISKVLSLSYTLVTPLMNPVIYSLRSKDMKKAFKKMLSF
uniref:G-protein coupled receptors family 1 profile domain-containing protein n=1 Tax=Xenopus tropicalis TaxID=8364 RepID=A0A6I8SNX7_XENTR